MQYPVFKLFQQYEIITKKKGPYYLVQDVIIVK